MKKLLYLLKSIKYLFTNRYEKLTAIELSTGVTCTHYRDNLKNCTLIRVK